MSTMSVLSATCFAASGGMECRHCDTCQSGRQSGTVATRGSGGHARDQIVTAARRDFGAELSAGKTVICTERAFVATALRDAGEPPLRDDEAQEAGISDSPRRCGRESIASRVALIASARHDFAAESAGGKLLICSEAAWVSTRLRDAGQGALTDREVTALAIMA